MNYANRAPKGRFSAHGRRYLRPVLLLLVLLSVGLGVTGTSSLPNLLPFLDSSGVIRTYSTLGSIETSGAFFQSLGTNGRSCVTCHQPSDAWSVTPSHLRVRFLISGGRDPIFRPVDGANCPSADVSTVAARQRAYSNLLGKGLIRVTKGIPDGAEFTLASVDDPFDCKDTTAAALALFRRPLPAANLPFLTTVMWDGRESFKGESLGFNLTDQALQATLGHAQAAETPTADQLADIVNFELTNFTAQSADFEAGSLTANGGAGGPTALSQQQFFVGINDPLGGTPPGVDFNPRAMTMFNAWSHLKGKDDVSEMRASIARGQELFNTLPIPISGVTGLNDAPGVPSSFSGTCTTCHNTPNVGNHSVALAINIGVTDYPAMPALDITGLPVYTLQCAEGAATPIGKTSSVQTTDPGRALVTGKCADIGKTKGPILRGLAARAPYFHNGSAATLPDVLKFYEQRFGVTLTVQQEKDLVAFLRSL